MKRLNYLSRVVAILGLALLLCAFVFSGDDFFHVKKNGTEFINPSFPMYAPSAESFSDNSGAAAQSGVFRTANNVCAVGSRNAAGNGDVCPVLVNSSNVTVLGGSAGVSISGPFGPNSLSLPAISAPSGVAGQSIVFTDSGTNKLKVAPNNTGPFAVAYADTAQTWSGTQTSMALATPTISNATFNSGVTAGSGVKHQRFGATTATGTTQGNSAVTTETWSSAFADANYSVNCTGIGAQNAPTGLSVESKTASTFVVRVFNLGTGTAASYTGVDCIAFHD